MSLSPLVEAHARVHDAARRHALTLRRQAVDDFWRGAGAALSDPATRALRTSARLLARWRRHGAARSDGTQAPPAAVQQTC